MEQGELKQSFQNESVAGYDLATFLSAYIDEMADAPGREHEEQANAIPSMLGALAKQVEAESDPAKRADLEADIEGIHERIKALEERAAETAHNYNLAGADDARAAGVRVTAAGTRRDDEFVERKRREDRFQDVMLQQQLSEQAQIVHAALGDYGGALRDELARRQKRAGELADKIEATEELLILLNNDELDRENPDHLDLIERAGLNPDMPDEEMLQSGKNNLEWDRLEQSANDAAIAEIERQLPLVREARLRIENGEDPEVVMQDLEDQGIHIDVENFDRNQVYDQIAERSKQLDAELQQRQATAEIDQAPIQPDAEQEIADFMQSLALKQNLMITGSDLVDQMQDQIDGLSEDARAQLEASEDTAFLFDETEAPEAEQSMRSSTPEDGLPPAMPSGLTP